MNRYWVYIVTNRPSGTLYIGVTNNLEKRLFEHRNGLTPGFTKRYDLHVLVYCEETASIQAAIAREKQLKKWKRDWKIQLIQEQNPRWDDLAKSLGF